MQTNAIDLGTKNNLTTFSSIAFVNRYYLAGGTALALHYGHRLSFDTDFFSQNPVNPEVIIQNLKKFGKVEVAQNDFGTFNGLFNHVKVSFFIYPYRCIDPFNKCLGIQIAGIRDIACMKLEAISTRGIIRDFIDLYQIMNTENIDIATLLSWVEEKFEGVKYQKLHFLKSLLYFNDAKKEEMPKMLTTIDWNEVTNFFKKAVLAYSQKIRL